MQKFSEKPILVFWETTRACLLACKHCRASAQESPLPGELPTGQVERLLRQIHGFGRPPPVVIFTGGDPMLRPDLFHLLRYAQTLGLPTAVSPAVTSLLTREALQDFRSSGVRAVSFSIDGANRFTHDKIRGLDGTFQKSIELLEEANELGLNMQINTTVMQSNLRELPDIFHLVKESRVRNWEVFFLIQAGRAPGAEDLTPQECEAVCNFLYDASSYGITIRPIEAPFSRRVASERASGMPVSRDALYDYMRARMLELEGPNEGPPRSSSAGTLDGDGILFVGFYGTVTPGGFLPIPIGNIMEESLTSLYRQNDLLIKIRNRQLSGKCGICSFKAICGGSRARAYASTGDPLASDPGCVYDVVT